MPDPFLPEEQMPQVWRPESTKGRKVLSISAIAGTLIILVAAYGVTRFRNGETSRNAFSTPPVASSASPTQSPVINPVPLGYRTELLAGMRDRNNNDCPDAIMHFGRALVPATTLSISDQSEGWVWLGLCQYEAHDSKAALDSFLKAKSLDTTNSSADYWATIAGLPESR